MTELEKCRAEISELEDNVKWLNHIWQQEKEEVKELKDVLKGLGWRQIKFPSQKRHQYSFLFQRKHRKWALLKISKYREWLTNCTRDCEYHYEQSKRFKARVGELKAILQKHGITHE